MTSAITLRSLGASIAKSIGLIENAQRSASLPWRILMYHRVIPPSECPYPLEPGMYVQPNTFEMHLDLLAKSANVTTLESLLEQITQGRSIPPGTVALTFDDGWVDNYKYAYPLLRRYNIPATIFLATSLIGTDEMLWTDYVAYALSHASDLERGYLLNEMESDETPRLKQLVPRLKSFEAQSANAREALGQIVSELKKLPVISRERFCQALRVRPRQTSRPRSFLTWDEIKEMSMGGISFGSHSHSHEIVTERSEDDMREDFMRSYQVFRDNGITPSTAFCYPGGFYDERSQRVLSDMDVRFACITSGRLNLAAKPALFNRIGIHEDIASTEALFCARIWLNKFF